MFLQNNIEITAPQLSFGKNQFWIHMPMMGGELLVFADYADFSCLGVRTDQSRPRGA